MKRIISLFLILFFILLFFCSCSNNKDDKARNSKNKTTNTENYINNEYSASRTSSNNSNNKEYEKELSSFSTKIYTPNDKARQNNIKITCSKLNETVVKSRGNLFFLRYSGKSHS